MNLMLLQISHSVGMYADFSWPRDSLLCVLVIHTVYINAVTIQLYMCTHSIIIIHML